MGDTLSGSTEGTQQSEASSEAVNQITPLFNALSLDTSRIQSGPAQISNSSSGHQNESHNEPIDNPMETHRGAWAILVIRKTWQ